jgi:ferrous iron transport protein A
MLLSDAPAGASFKVIKVNLDKEVGKRLADMGFIEGSAGALVRESFFSGPLQVRIMGYDVLIRRFEASGIEVEPVGDWSAAHDARRRFGGLPAKKVKAMAKDAYGTPEARKAARGDVFGTRGDNDEK